MKSYLLAIMKSHLSKSKTAAKKSVSVFLAILMLLSCWVFFAPEAEAVDSSGSYTWRIKIDCNDAFTGKDGTYTVYVKSNNGTTNGTSVTGSVGAGGGTCFDDGSTGYIPGEGGTTTSNGFPYQCYVYVYKDSGPSSCAKTDGQYWAELQIKDGDGNWQTVGTKTQSNKCSGHGKVSVTTGALASTSSLWPKPNSVSWVSTEANDTKDLSLSASQNVSRTMNFNVFDQYGVRMSSTALTNLGKTPSATVSGSKFGTVGTSTGSNIYYSISSANAASYSITVTAKTAARGTDFDYQTISVNPTCNGKSAGARSFKLYDPIYTFSFDANDPNSSDTANANASISPNTGKSKYYYNYLTAEEIPSSGSRTGYEFIAMYSPAKSPSYAATKPTPGSTTGYTGQLTTSTPIASSKTWYAAWWAKNVTVTLVDNMGNVLKTFTGKYDKLANYLDNDWPTEVEFKRNTETGTFDYTFNGHWKVIEAKKFLANGTQAEYQGVYGTDSQSFTLKGDTVFQAQYDKTKSSYSVKFYGETGNVLRADSYVYRDQPVQPTTSKATDNYFTYTFKGWHRVLDGEQKTGYIVNKDGYLSTSATSDAADLVDGKKVMVGTVDDFTVRSDAEYVPVFEKTYNEYTVTFKYKTATGDDAVSNNEGKTYHFGDALNLPELPKPTKPTEPVSYTFGGYRFPLVDWTKNNAAIGSTALPATLNDSVTTHATKNVTYEAVYGSGIPAEYDVTFTFIQADGTETTVPYIINHNAPVTAPVVPQTYRDDDYEYTFAGWKDQDGVGLVTPAYKDAFYVAQYTSKKLYTVSFINEGAAFGESAKYVAGDTIIMPVGTPAKAADKTAWQYTFKNWVDENGTAVTVMPENDLVLYADYTPSYIEYTINFVWKDSDGNDVTDTKTYHYRDAVTIPKLDELDQTTYKDDTYTYTFKAWDKDVAKHCTGEGEMSEDGKTAVLTYTATYRREYNYYTVTWMKESGTVDGEIQYGDYMTDAFLYNEKVRIPTVAPDSVQKPSNPAYSMVLDHWAYKDENGNLVAIDRDTRITGSITFYPVYKEAAKVCTVNLYNDDGTQLVQVIKVAYNTDLATYKGLSIPKKVYNDDTHFRFTGWVDKTTGTPVTVITDDCDLKATYQQEAHTYDPVVADKLPTFFEKGIGSKTCTECGKVVTNVAIDMLPDAVAPTAKLFIKDAVIESGAEVPTDALLVAPKNNLIVATVDTADTSEYNDAGKGIGTGKIEYFVTAGNTPVAFESITGWKTRFDYDTYVAELQSEGLTAEEIALAMSEFEANATAYVGDLSGETAFPDIVKDGETFIFYAKITDRQGGEAGIGGNVCYVRSQPLTYDATAAEITLTGDGNGMSKFCTDVAVSVSEDNELVSVTVDGEPQTLSADGKGASFVINTKGFHQIVATDVAGNVTVKNIEILGSHNEKSYVTAATCTEKGTTITYCTVCGKETKEPVVVPELGHDFIEVDKVEKTCTDNGYTLYRCTRCGITEKRDIVKDDGNHKYGEPVVSTKATCTAKGKKYSVCSVCGEYKYESIPVDPTAHRWYRGVVTKPTCTEEGYTMHTCKYCGTTEMVEGSTTEALGHEPSGKWVVITEASCAGYDEETKTGGTVGERVQYCKRDGAADCNHVVQVSEPIPVPNHMWKFIKAVEPTTEADGYTEYRCQSCNAVKIVPGDPKLVEHSVTFMVDGEVYKTITKIAGESVTVEDPTKAADKTYKYSFLRWEDADGKKVDLPVAVDAEKDIVLNAVFAETQINYTYIFYTKAKTEPFEYVQFKKVGYLKYDEAAEAQEFAGPADYEDEGASYKFVGWVVKGTAPVFDVTDADGNVITKGNVSKSIKISEVDFDANNTAEFEAVFEKIVKKVNVTYAYDLTSGTYIYTKEINYGDKVENINTFIPEEIMNTVKKDADDVFHYTFKEWKVREGIESLQSVTKNTLALAVFTANEHDFKNVEGAGHYKAPTCTEDGYQDTKCECGKVFKKILPATGHTWSTTPDENGQVECSVCGEKKDYDAKFTVTFYNENGSTIKKLSDIKWNEDIKDKIPTNVTKESDDRYDYKFSHWYVKGDETKTKVEVATVVKADAEYVAAFTATARKYKVIYRVEGSTAALQVTEVEYGAALPAYKGATPVNDKYDDYQHFVFDDWSKSAADFPDGVTGDVVITAVFTREGHQIVSVSRKNATCTEPMKETFKCEKCGYGYVVTSGKALGHKWVLVESVDPTESTEGYELYKCDRAGCDETYKKVLPPKTYIYFTVIVVDQDGNPVQGATVTIFDGTKFVASGSTDAHGKVIFKVEEAKKYRVVVEYNKQHIEGYITVNPDGSTEGGSIGVKVTHCSCTCHRDGIWPAIFRFFHKIIKMIVGHFVCCGNPDARYGS